MQNAWIDEISSKSTEHWGEFVQNPDTSSAVVQTSKIVTNCKSNTSIADIDNTDNEQDDEKNFPKKARWQVTSRAPKIHTIRLL